MNMLFYMTRYPGVGGIENVTSLIVNKVISIGEDVAILSHSQQDGVVSPMTGVMLYAMPDESKYFTSANYEFADKVIAEGLFDAIIYQDSYAPTERIVCEMAQKHNIPLYVFEHNSPLFVYNKRDLEPITTVKGFLRRMLHVYLLQKEVKRKRYLLEHCKRYVLLSSLFIPELTRLTRVDVNDERITFINNPIITFDALQVKKDNIILCVCRLTKEKRVDAMLYIWKQICKQLLDWRFIIVGDGTERAILEVKVSNEFIPRVEFTGFTISTEYYQRAKIFWMTSKYEGWGMTLVEAMQQGCVPVVWHSFSSVTDIIDNEVNGFVVPDNDVSSFESSVMTLGKNPTMLHRMSDAAREKVKCFELDEIIKEWYKLFRIEV